LEGFATIVRRDKYINPYLRCSITPTLDLNPISQYESLLSKHQTTYADLNQRFNILSTIRLLVALGFFAAIFFYFKLKLAYCLPIALVLLVVFLVLLKVHGRLSAQRSLSGALVEINDKEKQFLRENKMPFANGSEYLDAKHPYSYDLDIYGDQSVFQYLNRTSLFKGESLLADMLNQRLSEKEILRNQAAIIELRQKLEWRQDFSAKAQLSEDKASTYEALRNWASSDMTPASAIVSALSFLLPILFLLLLAFAFIGKSDLALRLSPYAFLANLLLLMTQFKKIKQETVDGEESHKVIRSYSQLIESIEGESFESEKLSALRSQLTAHWTTR